MVVGQSGKLQIGAVIQARMKSERLPGKILMPLPFSTGKPLLGWVVDCIKKSKLIDKIILASSTDITNDPLKSFCAKNSIELFRGSEDDVLSRFVRVAQQNNFDIVIRLTGDNPIVDSKLLDLIIEHHVSNNNDYTRTAGLPLGMNFEVVSSEALYRIEKQLLQPEDREHVTLYIRNHDGFKKDEFRFYKEEKLDKIRLTVDYPSDFATLSLLLGLLQADELPGIELVLKVKQTNPWIFNINDHNKQKQQFSNIKEEVKHAAQLLQEADLKNAAQILIQQEQA